MSHLSKKQLIAIVAVTLVVLIALLLFAPRNIKLDNLTVKPNALYCLVVFGLPDRTNDDGNWIYDNKIKFQDIAIDFISIDFQDHSYAFIEQDSSELSDLKRIIARKGSYNSSFGIAAYSYENLHIQIWNGWFKFKVTE